MKRSNHILISALALTAGLVTSQVSAGTITTSALGDDESLILNLTGSGGTLISAVNFGGDNQNTVGAENSDVDINGLTHLLGATLQNGQSANNTSAHHLVSSAVTTNTSKNGSGVVSGFWGNFRAADAYTTDMDNLMGGIAGAASGTITLDITGLTAGQTYLFQGYWENTGATGTITFEGTDSQSGISGGTAGVGTLISYEFVAGDSVLNVSFDDWIQGYSLQTVPEPGSMALIGLGGLMMIKRRRRA